MTKKTKILIGILAIVIILAGGWWAWNFYYTCSDRYPELCDRSCNVDSDCYPGCTHSCGCLKLDEKCLSDIKCEIAPFSCQCVNNTCEIKEYNITKTQEVTIATDKTEYEQGETVKITITNNKEKEVLRPYKIYDGLGLQKYKNGQWTIVNEDAFHPRVCACGISCEKMPDIPLSSKDKLEIEWNQIIDWCEDKTMKEEKVTSGKYRFTFAFNKFEKTIYSPEFTIKEKSAVDPRCNQKVKFNPNCEIARIVYGYEFDSVAGKCKEVNASGGCDFETPFKTLEECQKTCEN